MTDTVLITAPQRFGLAARFICAARFQVYASYPTGVSGTR